MSSVAYVGTLSSSRLLLSIITHKSSYSSMQLWHIPDIFKLPIMLLYLLNLLGIDLDKSFLTIIMPTKAPSFLMDATLTVIYVRSKQGMPL